MEKNWVERRWLREQALAKGALGVWQAAAVAIDNTCAVFLRHYPHIANVRHTPQNGHRVLVTIYRLGDIPASVSGYMSEIPIQIIYEPGMHRIAVIEGHDRDPRYFAIDADETHAFLTQHGKEIQADEFSRIVLQDALFNVREVK